MHTWRGVMALSLISSASRGAALMAAGSNAVMCRHAAAGCALRVLLLNWRVSLLLGAEYPGLAGPCRTGVGLVRGLTQWFGTDSVHRIQLHRKWVMFGYVAQRGDSRH